MLETPDRFLCTVLITVKHRHTIYLEKSVKNTLQAFMHLIFIKGYILMITQSAPINLSVDAVHNYLRIIFLIVTFSIC